MANPLNGRIPAGTLVQVPGEALGCRLLPGPARSWVLVREECQARHGWSPGFTSAGDAYRSLEAQIRVFLQRYRVTPAAVTNARGVKVTDRRVWNGVAYWRWQGAAAAVPGTSNHGEATTGDIAYMAYGTVRFQQLAPILTTHGWSNREGASVGEAWHWTNEAAARAVAAGIIDLSRVNLPTPTGAAPAPIAPEDDMYTDTDRQVAQDTLDALRNLTGAITALATEVGRVGRETGFRFASEGTVYYCNLGTGVFYAVPTERAHDVLAGLEGDVIEVNAAQRDGYADLCRRARGPITVEPPR